MTENLKMIFGVTEIKVTKEDIKLVENVSPVSLKK